MSYDTKVSAIIGAYETGSSDYTSTVHAMVDFYVTKSTPDESMAPLLSLLGCRTVRYQPDSIKKRFDAPAQPAEVYEATISETLRVMLRLHTENNAGRHPHNAFALLDGLARKDRWRECLDTLTAANDLAALLVSAVLSLGNITPDRSNPMYALTAPCGLSLYTILNEWLKPVPAFSERTLMIEVAKAMFGETWYDLAFSDEKWLHWGESNEYSEINRFIIASIHGSPPPFRPNLLSAGAQEQEKVDLPGLELT